MKHHSRKIRKQIVTVLLYIICLVFCLFTRQWIFAVIFVGLTGLNLYILLRKATNSEQQDSRQEHKYTKQEYRDYLEKINSEFDIDFGDEE
ncbi:MAG: hypothetical protein NC489_15905 [Ruminococcus flavefaciens]|nr:hypothetical protein [Ruminococcus flavefaciens]